jgi:hypothetical protein
MGKFPYGLVLLYILFFLKLWAQNDDLKFQCGHVNFSGVIDHAEIRILSIVSANIKPYAKRLLPVNQGPR